jgi:hypothetical protein
VSGRAELPDAAQRALVGGVDILDADRLDVRVDPLARTSRRPAAQDSPAKASISSNAPSRCPPSKKNQ